MPYLTLLLAAAFALSPLFSSFDGFDPDLYPVPQRDPPVQPAGWAFAIWGPIYLWLVISAAFGAWRRANDPGWIAHRVPLAVSLAVGAIWLPVAQVSPVWATVLILVMLGGAITAHLRTPDSDPALARAPVGLFAGWLTAASSVSLGLLAAGYGLTGPYIAAYLSLALTLGGAVAVHRFRGSVAYPAAVAWAAAAIALQNLGGPVGLPLLAGIGALTMVGLAVLTLRG